MSLGIEMGWGAPSGWGLSVNRMISPRFDATGAAGLSLSGAKLALGARYYFSPTQKVSPWIGAAISAGTGLNNIEINSGDADDDDFSRGSSRDPLRTYSVRSHQVFHLRTGARWQPGRVGFVGTAGYGIVLGGDPLVIPFGMTDADRRVARALGPGGLEISLGILIGLGD